MCPTIPSTDGASHDGTLLTIASGMIPLLAQRIICGIKVAPKWTSRSSVVILRRCMFVGSTWSSWIQVIAANGKNFIVPEDAALKQFLLHKSDLAGLRCIERPWPTEFSPRIRLFDQEDLQIAATNRWGSLSRLEDEKQRIKEEKRLQQSSHNVIGYRWCL